MAMSLTNSRRETEQVNKDGSTSAPYDFEALFDQHWERLCETLFRLVGDWAEAQDLALETFMRLYQRPPRNQHNMSGWLYRVAMNLGFNSLRAHGRRQGYEREGGVMIIEENSPSNPELSLENLQEREKVRMTLARMKPRSAKMLILRYSGFSYAEIAAALQVSSGSVGTLLARAEREFEKKYE